MASIQQLEKLHSIQRLFYVEDSLESAVAGERIAKIIQRTESLIRQRAFLRDERRRLRQSTEFLDERKKALEVMRRDDWVPEDLVKDSKDQDDERPASVPSDGAGAGANALSNPNTILINIGGLMYEVPKHVCLKAPKSLLGQLASDKDVPFQPDKDGGFFYFERDWWLFRYILNFMRDGVLPDDRNLLSQLYREASFWNLDELHRAIEEQKLHLMQKDGDNDWWQKLPSWWHAIDRSAEKAKKDQEEADKKKKADFWNDSTYNGKVFLPLSLSLSKLLLV